MVASQSDTGIDLLVSDSANRRTVSLQVKFSKDFLVAHMQKQEPEFQRKLRACGWWTLNSEKLRRSRADYWVFVLQGFASKSVDYVVIPPQELSRRLTSIHHGRHQTWQVYLWVTRTDRCWETHDLEQQRLNSLIAGDKYSNLNRDFSKYLNSWEPVERLNTRLRKPELMRGKADRVAMTPRRQGVRFVRSQEFVNQFGIGVPNLAEQFAGGIQPRVAVSPGQGRCQSPRA